ncbi:hypothetical protein [Clostridium magnum]|uniref:Uncharacterized protein n=1 Tax=Clostridium magnum DSM 2767 TaxID=1121326 RepID=A0A161XGH7_9CLOT|nr:hypothetical protein [Clostridium magnum]KZL93706.1 hypothetical protein CLMAG_07570 [Clostridium magnum DSM 2767]SHI10024.1 hypothetical protein SAMN02745944_02491 [Clostridium magnum DSM 2767]
MATLSFDTPKTATLQEYVLSGTAPANATLDLGVQIVVTRADSSTEGYYLARQYNYTVDTAVTDTVYMPIIPQLSGTEAVTATIVGTDVEGWSIKE